MMGVTLASLGMKKSWGDMAEKYHMPLSVSAGWWIFMFTFILDVASSGHVSKICCCFSHFFHFYALYAEMIKIYLISFDNKLVQRVATLNFCSPAVTPEQKLS